MHAMTWHRKHLLDIESLTAEEITIGDVRLVIHESGDRLSLRVRDPKGKLAREFLARVPSAARACPAP